MQLENFSGKTVTSVKKEYWATLVVANLLEMGCIPIEGCWIPGNLPKKHPNRSVLFGSMRDAAIEVVFGLMPLEEFDRKFKKIARRVMLKVRPNRKYSRAGGREIQTVPRLSEGLLNAYIDTIGHPPPPFFCY